MTLVIDASRPSYKSLVAFLMLAILRFNHSLNIEAKHPVSDALLNNLYRLFHDKKWKNNVETVFKKAIDDYGPKLPVGYSIFNFLHDVRNNEELIDGYKSSSANALKLIKQASDLCFEFEDAFPRQQNSTFDDSKSVKDLDVGDADHKAERIYEELQTEQSQYIEEESKDLFLGTVGNYRNERDAQNILFTNKNLLTQEIVEIESEITKAVNQAENISPEEIKLQLVRCLMLYYAVPSFDVLNVLIGTPVLDFQMEEMVVSERTFGRIVIDIEANTVYLPTPAQYLHQESDEKLKHKHLPLPLEQKARALLLKVTGGKKTGRLKSLISQKDVRRARSFKTILGYRQYRMTAGKLSKTLPHYVLSICHDEVKTAYLQGGAYRFVHMGAYYTSLSVDDLRVLYRKTCNHYFNDAKFLDDTSKHVESIGSIRAPDAQQVSSFLKMKATELESLRVGVSENFWTFHNQLVLYTITLLNISTTHRPNLDPYYSAKTFIDVQLVQVTEKEVMKGFEGRIAVLSDLSHEQLRHYFKHLENLAKYFQQQLPKTSALLSSIEAGEQDPYQGVPLFFLVENGRARSVNRSDLTDYVSVGLEKPLAENFYRHLFSSELAAENVSRFLIATQMGHVSKGREAYSASSNFSPVMLKERLLPHLNNLFEKLAVKTVKPPNVQKYFFSGLSEVHFKPAKLGPFQREANRQGELQEELMSDLSEVLLGTKTPSKKLRISRAVQREHIQILKKNGFKKTHKTLAAYYQYQRSNYGWSIESQNSTPEKSPFNKTYGFHFTLGAKYTMLINRAILAALKDHDSYSIKERRVLLSLSALVSGQISTKAYLIEVAHLKTAPIDLGITYGFELTDKNGNTRSWLLNSLSVGILKTIPLGEIESISEDQYNAILSKSFELPKLPKLIRDVRKYLSLYLSSYLINYADRTDLQSSIGVSRYQALLGNYTELNSIYAQRQSIPFFEVDTGNEGANRIAPDDQIIALRSFSKEFSGLNESRAGHQKTLSGILVWESANEPISKSLPVKLIVDWVKTRLEEEALALSSIYTYFSKVYLRVAPALMAYSSIDDISDEIQVQEIFPQILKHLAEDYAEDDMPLSELKNFQHYLASISGLVYLYFEGTSILSISNVQSVLLESQFQACIKSLGSDDKLPADLANDLKLALILYKRCGLRLSELFKIRVFDICNSSKTIHITGSRAEAEKSSAGNRLIPYDILLLKSEQELIEKTLQNLILNNVDGPFLFNRYVNKLGHALVSNRVSRYLTVLLRSVTGDSLLSIKSLRKSFASVVFLRLFMNKGHQAVLAKTDLPKLNFNGVEERFFNEAIPANTFWLLADWIGHSSPVTTFQYYSQSIDLALFIEAESWLEKQYFRDYIPSLKRVVLVKQFRTHHVYNFHIQ